MTHITRRQFMEGSVAAGLGMALAGCQTSTTSVVAPSSRVLGANDEIRVAVVGINGRGGSHISGFGDMKGVRVAALCDVDRKVLDSKAAAFEKKYGQKVETYVDIRKLLENKDIDAISIATPNHLALAGHDLGLPGGQRCLRREALQSQPLRGAQVPGCRPQVRADRAARHAEPFQPELGQAGGGDRQRQVRQAAGLQGRGLQGWVGPLEHRLQADQGAAGESGLSTSGWARRPSSRTTRIWSTTTGTGSGTSATARSATRVSIRWTLPAGRFRAGPCPERDQPGRPLGELDGGSSARSPTRPRRPTAS